MSELLVTGFQKVCKPRLVVHNSSAKTRSSRLHIATTLSWPLLGQTVGLELRLHIAYTTTPY